MPMILDLTLNVLKRSEKFVFSFSILSTKNKKSLRECFSSKTSTVVIGNVDVLQNYQYFIPLVQVVAKNSN